MACSLRPLSGNGTLPFQSLPPPEFQPLLLKSTRFWIWSQRVISFHFVFPVLEPSPPMLYVTLHLKSWMRCINQIQWVHSKSVATLKKCTSFGARRILEWSNKHSQNCNCWLLPVSDWLNKFDWPRWVAISSLRPICSPNFHFIGGVGKQ
jgi:hypothetical protein